MALLTTAYVQAAAIAETISGGGGGGTWTNINNIIDGNDSTFGSLAMSGGGAGLSTLELDAVGTALAGVLPIDANVQGMLVRVVLDQTVANQILAGGTWFATSGSQDGINQEPDQAGTIPTTKTTVVFDGTHSIDGTLHAVVADRQTDWGMSSFDYDRATAATLDFQFASYLDDTAGTIRIYSIEFAATYAPGIRIYNASDVYDSALSPTDSDTARGTSLLSGPGAATTGYTLELDPATFDLGTGSVELGVGATKTVSLRGLDRDACIINDASNTAGSNPLVHPASGSVIEDVTISLADVNCERGGLGCSTTVNYRAFTGVVLNRVTFDCANDAIVIGDSQPASFTANDCILRSGGSECFAQNGAGAPAHSATFNNCEFDGEATAVSLNSGGAHIAVGTAVFNNCTISAKDASDLATFGIHADGATSTVILNNCTVTVESENDSGVYGLWTSHASASIVMNGGSITSSTTGASTVYDAYAEAGSITLNGVQRSGQVSGNVTVVDGGGGGARNRSRSRARASDPGAYL